MQGSARGTMQGSCLPPTAISDSSSVSRRTLRCALAMDGVGLRTARKRRGMPSVMPPSMPPARFVRKEAPCGAASSGQRGSLFSLPWDRTSPNAKPLTAGMAKSACASLPSSPPKQNPNLKGNIRDYATINQLICLSNMENLNAVFINDGLPQSQRLEKLNQIAIAQMKVLENIEERKLLK